MEALPGTWRGRWPDAGVRFVHVSSLAAVGPSPDGIPVTEDAAPHPPATYGKSKLEGGAGGARN